MKQRNFFTIIRIIIVHVQYIKLVTSDHRTADKKPLSMEYSKTEKSIKHSYILTSNIHIYFKIETSETLCRRNI